MLNNLRCWFRLSPQNRAAHFWWWLVTTFGKVEMDPDCDGITYSGTLGPLYVYSSAWRFSVSTSWPKHINLLWLNDEEI